jgi:hypothetical protein
VIKAPWLWLLALDQFVAAINPLIWGHLMLTLILIAPQTLILHQPLSL